MAKGFDLENYKKSIEVNNVEKKKDKFVILDECIQEVIGIPGVPLGHVTMVYGKSDTGKCLSLDSTYISTANGIMNIRSAMDTAQNKIENKTIGYWLNDGVRNGKKITLTDGSIIEGTNIHKVKVLNKELQLEWKKFEDIELGDWIPNVQSEHLFDNKYDESLAELIGWLVADGHFSGRDIKISGLLEPKKSIIRDLMKKCDLYSENEHYLYINKENTIKLGLEKHTLSAQKTIPEQILRSNLKAIFAFIRGLFSGDSSIACSKNGYTLEYTTASYELARQLQYIFKSVGIGFTIRDKFVKSVGKKYARCTITGGIDSLVKYMNLIGYSHPDKKDVAQLALSRKMSRNCDKSFIPYANSYISNDYKNSNMGNRSIYQKVGNLVRLRDELTIRKWKEIRQEKYISEETKKLIDNLAQYNFISVASIEDWVGEVGDPNIPEDHTYHANNMITHNTSLLFHAAAKAQQQGVLPIFIMTEGKVDWTRAEKMGVNMDQAIKNEECMYLEEAFTFIDKIVSDVTMGELPHDVMILWDSVGSLPSKDEVKDNEDGTTEKKASMMRAAKAIRENMRIIQRKINATRNYSYPKYVGLMILNQAYIQPPSFVGGMSKLVPYGGDAIWYAASAVWKMMGKGKLSATKDGKDFDFGLISKISVEKNHISDLAMAGDFVVTPDAFLPNEKGAIKKYKDEHRDQWGSATIMSAETGEVLDE